MSDKHTDMDKSEDKYADWNIKLENEYILYDIMYTKLWNVKTKL